MWTSSDPTVATVGFYTGIVEAVGAGEVTITATTVDGSYTDSVTIKVYIDTVTVNQATTFHLKRKNFKWIFLFENIFELRNILGVLMSGT